CLFFFQAEDGIRDFHVTGVQTCALPIFRIVASGVGNISESDIRMAADVGAIIYGFSIELPPAVKRLAGRDKVEVQIYNVIYELRSEERRVGKESRCGGSACSHTKKELLR